MPYGDIEVSTAELELMDIGIVVTINPKFFEQYKTLRQVSKTTKRYYEENIIYFPFYVKNIELVKHFFDLGIKINIKSLHRVKVLI